MREQFSDDDSVKILSFFLSFRGVSLTSVIEERHSGEKIQQLQAVLDLGSKALKKFLPTIDLRVLIPKEKMEFLSKQDLRERDDKFIGQKFQEFTKENSKLLGNLQFRQLWKSTIEAVMKRLEAVVDFNAAMDVMGMTAAQKLSVLQIKAKYDQKITELAKDLLEENLIVSFNPHEFSLPSQAVDNARRLAYCQLSPYKDLPPLDENDPNRYRRTLINILKLLGVIEPSLFLENMRFEANYV